MQRTSKRSFSLFAAVDCNDNDFRCFFGNIRLRGRTRLFLSELHDLCRATSCRCLSSSVHDSQLWTWLCASWCEPESLNHTKLRTQTLNTTERFTLCRWTGDLHARPTHRARGLAKVLAFAAAARWARRSQPLCVLHAPSCVRAVEVGEIEFIFYFASTGNQRRRAV